MWVALGDLPSSDSLEAPEWRGLCLQSRAHDHLGQKQGMWQIVLWPLQLLAKSDMSLHSYFADQSKSHDQAYL